MNGSRCSQVKVKLDIVDEAHQPTSELSVEVIVCLLDDFAAGLSSHNLPEGFYGSSHIPCVVEGRDRVFSVGFPLAHNAVRAFGAGRQTTILDTDVLGAIASKKSFESR